MPFSSFTSSFSFHSSSAWFCSWATWANAIGKDRDASVHWSWSKHLAFSWLVWFASWLIWCQFLLVAPPCSVHLVHCLSTCLAWCWSAVSLQFAIYVAKNRWWSAVLPKKNETNNQWELQKTRRMRVLRSLRWQPMQRFVRRGLRRLLLGFDVGTGEKYLYHRSEIGTGKFKLRLRLQPCTKSLWWLLKIIAVKKQNHVALVQQLECSQRLVYSTLWACSICFHGSCKFSRGKDICWENTMI